MMISSTSAFGQVYEYECNTPDPAEEMVFLTLCDNSVYIFGFRLNWKDIYTESIISTGFYEKNHNDTIVLNDQVNGYQMIVKKDKNNNISVVKGWCFMKNLKLDYRRNHSYTETNYDSTYYTLDSEHSLDDLMNEREMYRKQTTLRDFKSGAYKVAEDFL